MITPQFSVSQSESHVLVCISVSSMHCKIAEAQFDICEEKFLFHCKPYYLRLVFEQRLAEGRDERATFNAETVQLTVYLPKETPGEHFTSLDDPAFLIATSKQRQQILERRQQHTKTRPLIQVLSSTEVTTAAGEGSDGSDDELETEYVQTIQQEIGMSLRTSDAPTYGFNLEYSAVFRSPGEEVVYDAVDLRDAHPDDISNVERRVKRVEEEQLRFDEAALWCSLADEDGEVDSLLSTYVPWYVEVFEHALAAEGVQFLVNGQNRRVSCAAPVAHSEADAIEEDEVLPEGCTGVVNVWSGNVALFDSALLKAHENEEASVATSPPSAGTAHHEPEERLPVLLSRTTGSQRRLAAPSHVPEVQWSMEETDALVRIQNSKHQQPFESSSPGQLLGPPPSDLSVASLTVDLLLSFAYDHVTTSGKSSSESVWTLCKLSPSLSWLDTLDTLYDVCVAFTRRCLVFPLHRHLDIVRRCFRDVGVILLLGPTYVVRCLLSMKHILDHSEHKAVLSRMYLTPLVQYWLAAPRTASVKLLQRTAWELHEIATRSEPVTVDVPCNVDSSSSSVFSVRKATKQMTLHPIHVLTVGLPISED